MMNQRSHRQSVPRLVHPRLHFAVKNIFEGGEQVRQRLRCEHSQESLPDYSMFLSDKCISAFQCMRERWYPTVNLFNIV